MATNEKKMVKVVCSNNPEADNIVNMMVDNPNDCSFSGVYLHGEVESECGFDCVYLLNPSEFDKLVLKDAFGNSVEAHGQDMEGVYPCKVYGVEEECEAYLWKVRPRPCNYNGVYVPAYTRTQGLIVKKSDVESVAFAKRKFEAREEEI